MLKYVLTITLFACSLNIQASGLLLSKQVKVIKIENGVASLEVSLNWNNSWRDEYNNDAVWVFFKWKTSRTDWEHVSLSRDASAGSGFSAYPGQTDAETVGFFIYRDQAGSGNASTNLEVHWSYPSWLTESMFRDGEVSVIAMGVEMVLVPFGTFSLGDGISSSSFCSSGSSAPVIISSEQPVAVGTLQGGTSSVTLLPASYPKGYNGFYCMKYELSQGQYTSFLNCLSRSEQISLLGDRVASLPKGAFLFGGGSSPAFRNTISVKETMSDTRAAVFSSGMDHDSPDDSPIGAGYLSIPDLLGYCSWAGLRPLSELEYEKISRRSAPVSIIPGEYAWGTASFTSLSGLLDADRDTERPASGNVNGGFPSVSLSTATGVFIPGTYPVRCGAFSSSGRTREASGSSFSGVMELSGNLRELCVSREASAYNGSRHGNGSFNLRCWEGQLPSSTEAFGCRGGGFSSPSERLRVSDRAEMTGFLSALSQRDPATGFRCVRMFDVSSIRVEPGAISGDGMQKYCSGQSFSISGTVEARIPGLSGVEIRYQWYQDGGAIVGAQGGSLSFPSGLSNAPDYADKTYRFIRKATSALGEAETMPVEITIYGKQSLSVIPGQAIVNSTSSKVLVASVQHAGEISWWLQDAPGRLLSGPVSVQREETTTFTPSYFDFGYKTGTYSLLCRAVHPAGCRDSVFIPATVSVRILGGQLHAVSSICMGELLTVSGSEAILEGMPLSVKPSYSWYLDEHLLTGQSGSALSISSGLRGGRDYRFFRRATVDDGSYGDSDSITVHIERCIPSRSDGTPYKTIMVDTCEWLAENLEIPSSCGRSWANASTGRLYDWEAAGCSCPPGWRLPSIDDWAVWFRIYDPSNSGDLGKKMKTTGDEWLSGGRGTNESGFSGLPGGYMRSASSTQSDTGIKGYWWSSSQEGSNPTYYELSNLSSALLQKTIVRGNGLSVRCVRNE